MIHVYYYIQFMYNTLPLFLWWWLGWWNWTRSITQYVAGCYA